MTPPLFIPGPIDQRWEVDSRGSYHFTQRHGYDDRPTNPQGVAEEVYEFPYMPQVAAYLAARLNKLDELRAIVQELYENERPGDNNLSVSMLERMGNALVQE